MIIPCFMTIGCTELYLFKLQWCYPVFMTIGWQELYLVKLQWSYPMFYDHRMKRVISSQITMMISCFFLWPSGAKNYIWSNYYDDILFFMTIGCTELYLVKQQWWHPVFFTIRCSELHLVQLQWWYPMFYDHQVLRVTSGQITMMIPWFFLPSGAQSYSWSNINDDTLAFVAIFKKDHLFSHRGQNCSENIWERTNESSRGGMQDSVYAVTVLLLAWRCHRQRRHGVVLWTTKTTL